VFKIKIFIVSLVLAFATAAFANDFTFQVGAGDIGFTPTVQAQPLLTGEFGFSVSPSVDLLVGAGATMDTGTVFGGVRAFFPQAEASDAAMFVAARAGVGTDWGFSDFYWLGTATLGVRGDNGLQFEAGALFRGDFGFSGVSIVPVASLGYSIQF